MLCCICGVFFVLGSNTSDTYGVAVWLSLDALNREIMSTDVRLLNRLLDTSPPDSFCPRWLLIISSIYQRLPVKLVQQVSFYFQ